MNEGSHCSGWWWMRGFVFQGGDKWRLLIVSLFRVVWMRVFIVYGGGEWRVSLFRLEKNTNANGFIFQGDDQWLSRQYNTLILQGDDEWRVSPFRVVINNGLKTSILSTIMMNKGFTVLGDDKKTPEALPMVVTTDSCSVLTRWWVPGDFVLQEMSLFCSNQQYILCKVEV